VPPSSDVLGARILIVDDQASNVRLLEHTLRRGGQTNISLTTDPTEVAAMHEKNRYDLVLLDLQMPVMSGYEVMAELQRIESRPRVAILVMSADPSQKLAALEAGAASFLSKPFVLAEVVAHVQRMLETIAAKR
jgi:CheY-like chemotaxis protein